MLAFTSSHARPPSPPPPTLLTGGPSSTAAAKTDGAFWLVAFCADKSIKRVRLPEPSHMEAAAKAVAAHQVCLVYVPSRPLSHELNNEPTASNTSIVANTWLLSGQGHWSYRR